MASSSIRSVTVLNRSLGSCIIMATSQMLPNLPIGSLKKTIRSLGKQMTEPITNYTYRALVVNVVDGDTIDVTVDLGFKISSRMRLRLAGINAPETRGSERQAGLESKHWLNRQVLARWITVVTERDKKGKYGRYLATLIIDGVNINEKMVARGYAKWYESK